MLVVCRWYFRISILIWALKKRRGNIVVADMVADMAADMVADTEVDMVADMEVNKVDDIAADKKNIGRHGVRQCQWQSLKCSKTKCIGPSFWIRSVPDMLVF